MKPVYKRAVRRQKTIYFRTFFLMRGGSVGFHMGEERRIIYCVSGGSWPVPSLSCLRQWRQMVRRSWTDWRICGRGAGVAGLLAHGQSRRTTSQCLQSTVHHPQYQNEHTCPLKLCTLLLQTTLRNDVSEIFSSILHSRSSYALFPGILNEIFFSTMLHSQTLCMNSSLPLRISINAL